MIWLLKTTICNLQYWVSFLNNIAMLFHSRRIAYSHDILSDYSNITSATVEFNTIKYRQCKSVCNNPLSGTVLTQQNIEDAEVRNLWKTEKSYFFTGCLHRFGITRTLILECNLNKRFLNEHFRILIMSDLCLYCYIYICPSVTKVNFRVYTYIYYDI